MKTVYILRSVPGAGKSTLAEQLIDNNHSSIICCADDYFLDDLGNYNWDQMYLGSAHKWCYQLFEQNLIDQTEIIVVANTNTKETDVNQYRNLAIQYNYKVFVMIVENYHNGEDIHNVPSEVKQIMKDQIIKSIKL